MVSMLEFRVPEPGISLKAHYQRYYKVRPGAYRVVVAGAGGVGKEYTLKDDHNRNIT